MVTHPYSIKSTDQAASVLKITIGQKTGIFAGHLQNQHFVSVIDDEK